MNKFIKYLILIIFLVIYNNSYSQWQKMFEVYATIYEFTGNSNYVFCATGPTGVFRSSDNGLTWDTVNSGLENKNAQTITAQGSYIFVGTDSGLFRSTNNGDNWSNIPNYRKYVYHLACNNQFIFAGTILGIYRSSDHGITWDSINNGLPRQPYGLPAHISAISISSNFIYIGIRINSFIPHIYKTSNYGDNWIPIMGMDSIYVYSLESKDSIILCGTNKGVYISRNYGLSWRLIPEINHNIGLFGLSIIDERNIIIASYGYGVQVSEDGGLNWVYKNEGINPGEYNSCALYSTGNFTFLGTRPFDTYYPAVFRRNTSQLIPVIEHNIIMPKEFSLFQNFPNPFNPTTNIPFELKEPSHVTLKVFDARGREVKELVNGRWGTGKFIADFDASALATGIYFYQIIISGESTHQTFTATRKMIFLK